jgi:tryptophan synthase alpha chain
MSRIPDTFAALDHPAFIPFFTVGDPDLAATEAFVKEAAARGADLIELGVPFSDPIADGPTIQASYYRALERGFKLQQLFEMVKRLRDGGFATPLIAMISESLVFKRGLERFLDEARDAGLDGLIIPDLPLGYEGHTVEEARARGLDVIFLCAPTTPPERRAEIAQRSSGFVYYISVAGITGTRTALPTDLARNVGELKKLTSTPVCVGFGISKPEHAAAVAKVADGVIVGSALVKRVAELSELALAGVKVVRVLGEDLEALARATHGQ